jgi:hypothetical protein
MFSNSILFAQEISGDSLFDLTNKYSTFQGFDIWFLLIHPEISVSYQTKYFDHDLQLEERLKKDYDLIRVFINVKSNSYLSSKFKGIIYDLKHSIKLKIDDQEINCIDFYDQLYDYSKFNSLAEDLKTPQTITITGYLLFPKTVKHETRIIEIDFKDGSNFKKEQWDYSKINKIIEVLKS